MEAKQKTENKFGLFLKRNFSSILPYLSVIFVIVLFTILSNGLLLSTRNLRMLFNQIFPTLIMCVGSTFLWAHGSVDLSIGSVIGVAGIVAAVAINSGHMLLGLFGAIAVALVFAFLNSILTTVFHLFSILATLCMMFIASGIQSFITLKQVIYVDADMDFIDSFGMKLAVALIVIIVCTILFNFTSIGKKNIAIGGNMRAAEFSGVKVNKDMILAFLIAGVTIGIAAFFSVARLKTVANSFGSGMQFDVMTAMVLGGMIIGGGKNSKISNGVIGAITYTVLANGLQLAGMPTEFVSMIKGIVFLVVIALSFKRKKDGVIPA